MDLLALPAFADNLIWMLHNGAQAIVVDPGAASPVISVLHNRGLQLTGILVTHAHADHTGGLQALQPWLRGPIYGPAHEPLPLPYERVTQGTSCELLGQQFQVLDVPGHTPGHIAFFTAPINQAPLLFCGDTLFSAGCGRLLGGTAAQMFKSLSKLAVLHPDTRVFCAHEYTVSNLRFARAVEPHNLRIVAYQERCNALRAKGAWTLPSTIAIEREVNPFLRTCVPEVVASAQAHGARSGAALDVFAALREWKNSF